MKEAQNSKMSEMVAEQLRGILAQEMKCRHTINQAKTKAKRRYYEKKLRTLTKQAKGALRVLQGLRGKEGAKDAVLSK